MPRCRHTVLLLLGLLLLPLPTAGYRMHDESGHPLHEVRAAAYFQSADLPSVFQVKTDLPALLAVVHSTQDYLKAHEGEGDMAVSPGLFSEMGITLADVRATLHFVERTIGEDIGLPPSGQRMLQEDFLRSHFRVMAWRSDTGTARRYRITLPPERIRLTQYVVYRVEGRSEPDNTFNCALYEIPRDEQGLSASQAEKVRARLWRYRLIKQDILAGAFASGGSAAGQARPLIWLTRDGLEEALLEGTVVVRLPGQAERTFNVHRHNGIPYDRSIKDKRLQRRYWYFRQVDGIKGYGTEIENKITVMPAVTFAGDVVNLGLGKLIAIEFADPATGKSTLRLGVLADTGGAFVPNLYQLDYLSGIFDTPAQFKQAAAALPDIVRAYVVLAK